MEETQALLLAELDHRIKNTLAVVQAIVRQTLRTVRTKEEAESAVSARLRALARAHDLLRDRQWLEAWLGDIVNSVLAANSIEPSRVRVSGPRIAMSSPQALSIALALHELATNAIKHGSLSTNQGRVEIKWRVEGDNDAWQFVFEWREQDGPAVAPPTHVGFGSELIERVWAADFDADVALNYPSSGFVFTARGPWARPTPKQK